jgi:predicted enzyme involved in methoxymalonyl-ACP biosynthesis
MNYVVAHAVRLGLSRVCGQYIPTAKNAMVRDFFASFGFTPDAQSSGQWTLEVSAYQPRETFIRLIQTAKSDEDTEVP